MDPIQYFIRNNRSLQVGHFKLASGKHSNIYIQCAQVLSDPDVSDTLGAQMAGKVKHISIDLVISPAMGGLMIGQSTAKFLNRLHFFVEKANNVHGFDLRRGFQIDKNSKILIVEDVWTTAGSTMKVYNLIKDLGGIVVGMVSIINRMGISGQSWPDEVINIQRESLIDLTDEDIISKIPDIINPFQVDPNDCPLCKQGIDIVAPGSRNNGK